MYIYIYIYIIYIYIINKYININIYIYSSRVFSLFLNYVSQYLKRGKPRL